MKKTIAFVDGANLFKGIAKQGWDLDLHRFRKYLRDFFGVDTAYVFLAEVPAYRWLYRKLVGSGFKLQFRPISRGPKGVIKGNIDTDLAVHAIAGCCQNDYEKAVIVSGDGDFLSVCCFLAARAKLKAVVAPCQKECSHLLRRPDMNLVFLDLMRTRLERIKVPSAKKFSLRKCRATTDATMAEDLLNDFYQKWPSANN